MFEFLQRHCHIIVTGPHRSGTTIAATMISKDTGHRIIGESRFTHGFHELYDVMKYEKDNPVVFHSPLNSAHVHLLAPLEPAVVFIRRSIKDILASEKRINWGGPGWGHEPDLLKTYFRSEGVLAEVKYEVWDTYQKPILKHTYDIEYESLKNHPLWVPKEQRKNFKPHQLSI